MRHYHVDPHAGVVIGRSGKVVGSLNGRGYLQIKRRAGKGHPEIHRIIWEHTRGPIPDGMQINHKNGVKTDNRIQNLELVTPSQNTLHAYKMGLRRADGDFNGRAIGKRRKSGGLA